MLRIFVIGAGLGVTLSVSAVAQTPARLNPPHLAEMPSVERVKREVQGSDPKDTAMRQIGALLQFRNILYEMSSNQGRGRDDATPDEKRIADAYLVAANAMAVETGQRSGRWDVDWDFRAELLNKFFTPAFRATYDKGNKDFADRVQARKDADQRNYDQLNAAAAAAQKTDPGTEAARRCIASGRSPLDCIGSAMSTGLGDLFGMVDPSLKPVPLAPGLRMDGVYPGPGPSKFSVTFRDDAVEVACGPLIPAPHPYTAERRGAQIVVTMQSKPAPVAFAVQPNGSIVGPRAANIQGQVQVGIEYGTRTYTDGRTEPISRPTFETRTVECAIGTLSATGPSPRTALGQTLALPIFEKPAMEMANSQPLVATPGLRLTGTYAGSTGLSVEFHNDSAIITCRQAFTARTYRMEVAGTDIRARIDHGITPLVLTLAADGSLTGSGSTTVTGRVVAGVRDTGEVIYTPRSDTCTVGTLTPRRPS